MKPFLLQDKSFWGFKYAFCGLYHAIREESHLRFHICAAVGTAMFTEYYDFSKYDYLYLFLAIFLVIIAELINTAIEHTVDLCTDQYSEIAKRAKDVSAGFVFVSAVYSLITAYVLFFDANVLFGALMDIFTKPKYIVFFVLTVLFVVKGGKK